MERRDKFYPECGKEAVAKKLDKEEEAKLPLSRKILSSLQNITDTPDHTQEIANDDIDLGRSFAMFSYLGPLLLVPVIASRGSRYSRFHVGQGLNLFLALIIYSAVVAIFFALTSWIPMFGNFFRAIYDILEAFGIIFYVVLAVRGIRNSTDGKARELPFVGQFHIVRY